VVGACIPPSMIPSLVAMVGKDRMILKFLQALGMIRWAQAMDDRTCEADHGSPGVAAEDPEGIHSAALEGAISFSITGQVNGHGIVNYYNEPSCIARDNSVARHPWPGQPRQ